MASSLIRTFHDNLETTFQCLVFLEIFLVFIERRGTDGPQFSSCQSRFQNIGGIHGPFTFTGAHKGVYLIDEKNYLAIGLYHFIDYGFESFLKLSLVFGAGNQRAHIERIDLLRLQIFGHVTAHNTVSQTFGNGRLTGTGFSYENRVVLGASAQNLQHAADFIITADDRIQFTRTGPLVEVNGIFAQRVVCILGRGIFHFLPLPQLVDGQSQFLLGDTSIFQDFRCRARGLQNSHDYGFERHELVAQFGRIIDRLLQYGIALTTQIGLTSADFGQRIDFPVKGSFQQGGIDSQFLEHVTDKTLAHIHDTQQEVCRLDRLLIAARGHIDSLLHSFLRLDGKIVKVHILSLLSFIFRSSTFKSAKPVPEETNRQVVCFSIS